MPGVRASEVELALQIVAGDQNVFHRHLCLDMAEQGHQRRQAYARTNHFARICMSKLVRNDASGNTNGSRNIGEIGTQLLDQGLLAAVACQEAAVSQIVERAEEAQAVDEFTDERVYRDHSFRLQLAEGHMNRPAVQGLLRKRFGGTLA